MPLTKQDLDAIEELIRASEDRILGELGRDYKTFRRDIEQVHQRIDRLHPEAVEQS